MIKQTSFKALKLRCFIFCLFTSFLFMSVGWASVSLKNGNFFIGYTDILFNGGFEPKVERVYNSKSSHDGIFGFGWGSDYEVYLTISADGSVIAHENGGGAQNRFTPPDIDKADIKKAADQIMAAKRKLGAGISGSLAKKELARLLNDARYRNDEWEKLYRKGLVKARHLKPGTILKSTKFSFQTIKKTSKGYTRQYDNGKVETYDNKGRLVRVVDRSGHYINLSYSKSGQLSEIVDNLNRRLRFTFNRNGKVEKIIGDSKKRAYYKYKGDELVYSKDSDGNIYRYKYSSNGRHNLVEVKYQDGTTLQVGYNEVSEGETVKWVKERDGGQIAYSYGGDGVGGFHFYTDVLTKGADGKVVQKAHYEYWEKSKIDGERYTYKMLTKVNDDETVTIFNECCGMPLEIVQNGEKTSFEYDRKGHVTRKITPTEVTELKYDMRVSKVSQVLRYPKGSKNKKDVTWAKYQYDKKGNLVAAKNNEGKAVRLVYDHRGRIKAMVDQDKRQLRFKYNEANRPVEISDPKLGKIVVQYANSGEIRKVDSSGGRHVASSVTAAFQNLLEIIRPAGVTLTF